MSGATRSIIEPLRGRRDHRHFHATAPNAVSVLRAFVFGRIAGREAVAALGAG
jgi:succinate dehydrogenase/fumarate reductase flavoprotein subunit